MSDSQEVKRPNSVSRLKIPALRGKDAPNNIIILRLIALRGSMNKYDLYSAFPGLKEKKNYPTVSRRVDDLVTRGYLTVTGSKIAREGTRRQQEVNVYGLTWRGLLAALSEEEVLMGVVAVLDRHKESLQFPLQDIVMKVLARWPEETRHDVKLFWTAFLEVLPGHIEDIPQEAYASFLFPSLAALVEQPRLPQRIDQQFVVELLNDPKIRPWAKRETAKTVQRLKSQLDAFKQLADYLGVKVE